MKKMFTFLMVVVMLVSMAMVVSAEESTKTQTTVLTTTVQPASYQLNIPENQEIDFGTTTATIGNVTVTNATGFARGKNVRLTVTYEGFKSEAVSTTIPIAIRCIWQPYGEDQTTSLSSGGKLYFLGKDSGIVSETPHLATGGQYGLEYDEVTGLNVTVNSEDWGKALAGDYTATITFTAEVVVTE